MIPRIKTKARLPERERVLSAVAEVAAESPALEARVFGSWARGTQSRRSDLDVLIIEETTEPFLRRLDRYLLPLYQAAGGPPVEVLVYAPSELAAMRERPFIRGILAESVLVYHRQANDVLRRPETTGDIAGVSTEDSAWTPPVYFAPWERGGRGATSPVRVSCLSWPVWPACRSRWWTPSSPWRARETLSW